MSGAAPSMRKDDAIRAVIGAAAPAPIIFTTGYASRIGRGIADRANHFYMTGSMGLCAPIATGLALATSKPVVAVDGDGSVLMNPTALVAAGALAPLPLVHVVLDDGVYASTGGQLTGSSRVDAAAWARSAGYRGVYVIRTLPSLTTAVVSAVAGRDGPLFLWCAVERSAESPPGRIGADLAAHARRLAAHVNGPMGGNPKADRKDH